MKRNLIIAGALALVARCTLAGAPAPEGVFFDDFSQSDLASLHASGWIARSRAGHPGIEGAYWDAAGLSLVDDPDQAGNRLLRLRAATDGTGPGTHQVQVCHQRKYLEGTYAARVRFSDTPDAGPSGDPVIQTFYAASPLRFDFDPQFSELDWEYLANGGWGRPQTRLYSVSWQTVKLDPWQAFNASHEEVRSMMGWHVLMMQVADNQTRWFVDGQPVAVHGGRNYPVTPMSISFSLWFSPNGPLPLGGVPRVYAEDVDWVFHAQGQQVNYEQVLSRVSEWRKQRLSFLDTVPAAVPALESRCDI